MTRVTTKTRLSFTSRTAITAKTFGRSASNITPSSDVWQPQTGKEKSTDCSAKDPLSGLTCFLSNKTLE